MATPTPPCQAGAPPPARHPRAVAPARGARSLDVLRWGYNLTFQAVPLGDRRVPPAQGGSAAMLSGDFKTRLESRLSKLGLSWEESGNFLKGVVDVGEGRTQVFLVDTNVDQFGPYQDHDILSPICRVADQESRIKSVAFTLLEFTGKQKVGHVAVINGILVYKADCGIDAPEDVFGTLLRTVCKMADTLEKILTEGLDAY